MLAEMNLACALVKGPPLDESLFEALGNIRDLERFLDSSKDFFVTPFRVLTPIYRHDHAYIGDPRVLEQVRTNIRGLLGTQRAINHHVVGSIPIHQSGAAIFAMSDFQVIRSFRLCGFECGCELRIVGDHHHVGFLHVDLTVVVAFGAGIVAIELVVAFRAELGHLVAAIGAHLVDGALFAAVR
jgi:hypothetical protein